MHVSPFLFGKVVSNTTFINRIEEKQRLISNLLSGINTIIFSPRRWGKTSLVKEVSAKLSEANKNIRFCFIDLFSLRSEEEFLEKFTSEVVKCSSTKTEEWLYAGKKFLNHLVPKISFGTDIQKDFSVSFDLGEVKKYKEEIINLPEIIAAQKKIKIIICIDEFQNIKNFAESDSFEKILRSNWQHHKNVTYCLYGSKRHLMAQIFNEKNKPFYRFGDIILLSKIASSDWCKFIVDSFAKTGKEIPMEISEKITALMKCHPYYVQQFSHLVWQNTNNTVSNEIIQKSIEDLVRWNEIFFQQEIDNLSNTQIKLLQAISSNERQLSSVNVMNHFQLGTPRNVAKNKKILEKKDIIDKTSNQYHFLDPVFEIWFKFMFMNKPFFL